MGSLNRLHFYKNFDPEANYVAIKIFETGGVAYTPGKAFDKTCMPMHKVKAMFNARKITFADALNNPADLAAIVEDNEEEIIDWTQLGPVETPEVETPEDKSETELTPEIEKKGAWFVVKLGGKQVGKAVRTYEEAEKIALESIA